MAKKRWLLIPMTMVLLSLLLLVATGCSSDSSSNSSTRTSSFPSNSLQSITLLPSSGSYLTNSENISSEVLLKDAQITTWTSQKEYHSPWYPTGTVNIGESILIVTGTIQNKHEQNEEIAIYAEGYDQNGKQVAWTLDAAHIAGQIGLHLEKEAVGQFTLHLNTAENIKSIRIFANNYHEVPP